VLGPMSDGGEYIQTVSKRGYRFMPSVQELADDELDGRRSGIPPPASRLAAAAVDFVGREPELGQMQEAWPRATAGHHQLLLIAGEPGIGKTRLALEFARRRNGEGITVLVGYSDEENVVPYQPFVECLSWYFRHCPLIELRSQLVAIGGGAELGLFVPELH